ncbi:MAG: hypothetical protein ABR575_03825 [Actinomycetota bacterium]
MPALAYLLPPLSGAVAYFAGPDPVMRFHGLQSVVLGTLWPVLLYLAAAVGPGATQLAFVAGAGAWLVLASAAARRKEIGPPGVTALLRRLSQPDPRARDAS